VNINAIIIILLRSGSSNLSSIEDKVMVIDRLI